ncbi:hypothetical protein GGTG_04461 [Gaeumannomyces tritici R3-111a-1]|uniref:Uncharacterized protein n=1 Tax=Gaeumannomyces tritici (strain R3-111a-1) TaxID=644352 RepID=J3NT63_GAET3|nr:hypothetical protein GGTG_04461 [Gaeumannomyces tritici R3-111a-1]EJT79377.1 hypothetical protein GGTG_04461 [Gaeumannomyces tritici R3-111a-1]
MSTESLVLAAADAAALQTAGLLRPGSHTGFRRLHKRRLNSSSDEEYAQIPLDIGPESFAVSAAFADIPVALFSRETLAYLGLSQSKADEIWSEWTNWPSTGIRREIDAGDGGLEITFIDYITARLENIEDVYEDDDDQWRQCLGRCGISSSVQDAIMDPSFKRIRLTNSCVFWVEDTIQMRFAGLEDIQRASRDRERALLRAASRPGGRGQAARPSGSGQGRRRAASASEMQQEATPGVSSMHWSRDLAAEYAKNSDCITLYKGMDQARMAGLFDNAGVLDNISTLLSSQPSDFSATRGLLYFASDYKVAEYYAAYAKHRANCESVVMICVSLPKETIDNMEAPELQRLFWPTPQWKQLVWRSKTGKRLPKPLRKYRDALLIIGTISKGAARMFENMQSWEDMTGDCILRVGPPNRRNPAVQYVFSGDEEGQEFLLDNGKFDVFRFSEEDAQILLTRNPETVY